MFYVNDKPDGKILYTETIKLYCIIFQSVSLYDKKKLIVRGKVK